MLVTWKLFLFTIVTIEDKKNDRIREIRSFSRNSRRKDEVGKELKKKKISL